MLDHYIRSMIPFPKFAGLSDCEIKQLCTCKTTCRPGRGCDKECVGIPQEFNPSASSSGGSSSSSGSSSGGNRHGQSSFVLFRYYKTVFRQQE